MIKCIKCGIPNQDHIKKCNGCGAVISKPVVAQFMNEIPKCDGVIRVVATGLESVYVRIINVITGVDDYQTFVPHGSHRDIDVKAGSFEMRYALGYDWINKDKLFGEVTKKYIISQKLIIAKVVDIPAGYLIEKKDGSERVTKYSI